MTEMAFSEHIRFGAGLSILLITCSVCCAEGNKQAEELRSASSNKRHVTMCHWQSQLTALTQTQSIPANGHRKPAKHAQNAYLRPVMTAPFTSLEPYCPC